MTRSGRTVADQKSPATEGPEAETWARLEGSLEWYRRNARRHNYADRAVRLLVIGAGAAIPLATALGATAVQGAILGAAIVLLRGLEETFRFQRNWIAYARAREGLERERALYLGQAGPYADDADRQRLLAVRIEDVMGRETDAWAEAEASAAPAAK